MDYVASFRALRIPMQLTFAKIQDYQAWVCECIAMSVRNLAAAREALSLALFETGVPSMRVNAGIVLFVDMAPWIEVDREMTVDGMLRGHGFSAGTDLGMVLSVQEANVPSNALRDNAAAVVGLVEVVVQIGEVR